LSHENVESLRNVALIAMALELAVAAAIGGYVEKMAFAEEARHYERAKALFRRASKRLSADLDAGDVEAAERLIRELGREALMENGDWVLLRRARPMEVPKGG
jgi:hypothetical protein